jgi:hypothetical protein
MKELLKESELVTSKKMSEIKCSYEILTRRLEVLNKLTKELTELKEVIEFIGKSKTVTDIYFDNGSKLMFCGEEMSEELKEIVMEKLLEKQKELIAKIELV